MVFLSDDHEPSRQHHMVNVMGTEVSEEEWRGRIRCAPFAATLIIWSEAEGAGVISVILSSREEFVFVKCCHGCIWCNCIDMMRVCGTEKLRPICCLPSSSSVCMARTRAILCVYRPPDFQ